MAKTKKKGKDDEVVINLDNMGVPIAILISGVLIAAVIFFASRGNTPVATDPVQEGTEQVAGQEQVEFDQAGVASIQDGAVLGNPETATVAVIEFSDYMCGFCKRHADETFPLIRENYVDTGKILYVFKEFPLSSPGQLGYSLAEGGVCVYSLSNAETFFDYHKDAFELNSEEDIIALAQDLGVDGEEMRECLSDGRFRESIDARASEGRDAGVTGTPGFVVGLIGEDGTVEGSLIAGAYPYETFVEAIEGLLE